MKEMAGMQKLGTVLILLSTLAAACLGSREPVGEQRAVDAAWKAFKANTSSKDRANWEVVEVRDVTGQVVAEAFAGRVAPGCWVGPTPPPNQGIAPSVVYWYVHMRAAPATPLPATGTVPPTAPAAIPEPFVRQSTFLIDRTDARVVARKIYCVIH
jgi:hypothetical protein